MTSKHTPGPWLAALERGCHGVIASTLPEGGANFVAIVGNDGNTPEREPERFSNCHLIAAAPELLEALEEVREMLWSRPDIAERLRPLMGFAEEAINQKALKAIAKAKGEG